jgi:hypothetical protein
MCPTPAPWWARKAEPGQRWDDHVKRRCLRRLWLGQGPDDVEVLDDRARPTLSEHQRQSVRPRRPDVDEVDLGPVDLGHELGEGIQAALD